MAEWPVKHIVVRKFIREMNGVDYLEAIYNPSSANQMCDENNIFKTDA
jgi:hypothetical protein